MRIAIKLLVFFLVLVVGLAGFAFYLTIYKPLPDYEATIELPGLQRPVDIYWDDFGVPHIFAGSFEDAYFAIGYVHAQDRLWQMTLSQIAAEGRFAEFFGEELLPFDKYQRTLGFWEIAKDLGKTVLDAQDKQLLDAYSAGVNSFSAKNGSRLPVEFSLTGMDPFEWNHTRTLATARLMAWELNIAWWNEVMFTHLRSVLSDEEFEDLRPGFPGSAPTMMNDAQTKQLGSVLLPALETELALRKLLNRSGDHVGSNAWVVDGSKTKTGFPLLAGDPHLALDMPGKWYEIHINVNGKNISGVTLPGIPAIIIGQNDYAAWSFTNIMADDTDFFWELAYPENRGRYIADSLADSTVITKPFIKRNEIIKVKNKDDVLYEVRSTERGPVISDIYPRKEFLEGRMISMQWTGAFYPSNELKAMFKVNTAESFEEVKQALPYFGSPGQNFIYADKDRNIAAFSVGYLPIRRGDPLIARRGWEPADAWGEKIPFDKLPKVINPESGWIANANNKLHTDSYPYYLGSYWEAPSRITRIEELIKKDSIHTFETFSAIQNDVYSSFAADLAPLVISILENTQEYDFELILDYLKNWDYVYSESATAASIFDFFILNLTKLTLQDEMSTAAYENFIQTENIPARVMTRLLKNGSSLFDNKQTGQVETRDDIVIQAMRAAMLELNEKYGEDQTDWRWGNLHTITFAPPFFAQAAEDSAATKAFKLIVKNLLSEGPYIVGGHGMSVNNGQYSWNKPFDMVLGASVRRIVDLQDMRSIRSVLPTGQSGHPFSGHFGDQTELWLNGNYRILEQHSEIPSRNWKQMLLKPAAN